MGGREDGKIIRRATSDGELEKRDKKTRKNKEKNKERVTMKETPIRSSKLRGWMKDR